MTASGIIILVLMVATLISLVIGLGVMARGNESDKKLSNKMMFWRVWLQAATIGAIILFLV